MPDQETLGQRLARFRQEKGWTVYRLAKESGVAAAVIGRLERDERDCQVSTVVRLARALGKSFGVLDGVVIPGDPDAAIAPQEDGLGSVNVPAVYFARHGELTKIGWSSSIRNRIAQLTEEFPGLELYHEIACTRPRRLEGLFHGLFANRHVEGEWFRLTAAELTSVRSVGVIAPAAVLPSGVAALQALLQQSEKKHT